MPNAKFARIWFSAMACVCALALSAVAQQPNQALSTKQLKPNIYLVEGAGGNSGVIVGSSGVIVIDTKTSPDSGKALLAEIAKVTDKPVKDVILTHSDGDHVGGLPSFPSGLTIIAHEGDSKEMEEASGRGGPGAPPKDKLPNHVVTKDKETLTLEGVKVEVFHWAPAHTSGDLVVYLPAEKMVFTGDIIATVFPDPLIHLEKNGSSAGWIKTAKGMAALDADQYVPGHGDVQTKAQIEERVKSAETKRAKVLAMVKQGKSLDDIRKELNDVPYSVPGAAPGRGPAFPTYVEVVYKEATTTKSGQ